MSSVGDESQGQGASQQKEEEDIYRRLPSIYQSSTQQQQQRPFQTKYKRLIDENALAGLTGRSKLIYIYRTDFGKRSADLDPASRFNNLDSKSSLWPLSISGLNLKQLTFICVCYFLLLKFLFQFFIVTPNTLYTVWQ